MDRKNTILRDARRSPALPCVRTSRHSSLQKNLEIDPKMVPKLHWKSKQINYFDTPGETFTVFCWVSGGVRNGSKIDTKSDATRLPKGTRGTPKASQWIPTGPKADQKSVPKTQFPDPFFDPMAQSAPRAPPRPNRGRKLS